MRPNTTGPAFGRVLGSFTLACRTLAILLLALMSTLIILQVLGRNLFDLGMPWADELSRFSGVALVFLCIPILAERGQHVAVDMIPNMLPDRLRLFTVIMVEAMVLLFAVMSLWGLYAFLGRAWKFATPTLGIPNWVFYAPAVIGMALLTLVTLVKLVTLLRGGALPHREPAQP